MFAITGIMAYVGFDAIANPLYAGKDRFDIWMSKWYPEIRGVHTMWTLPITGAILAAILKKPVPHGTLLGLIPPTLAFTTVKGHSMPWPWNGEVNMTAFEKDVLNKKKENKEETPESAAGAGTGADSVKVLAAGSGAVAVAVVAPSHAATSITTGNTTVSSFAASSQLYGLARR